jgi:glycosyltransferase involved in cell wall biosynthesis
MRLVQFVNNLDMGGLERMVLDLAQCQLAEGHETAIYCLTHPGRLAADAERSGIKIHSFEKPGGPSPGIVLKIARQLRIDRPDVLHSHNHLVHHYGVVAGKLAGVPVLVNTRHGSERVMSSSPTGSFVSNLPVDRISDLIYRATLPFVDSVVLISEATRRFYVQHRGVPASKARVILNGAHLEKFLESPAHPGGSPSRIRFGTAARLVPVKDHYTLLRAFATVVRDIPHAELEIAGDGPLRRELEAFTNKQNLSERVKFVGALPDTPKFLSELDIFVLSSLSEGMPISLLEAMAAGLPIVSTRAGGVDEVAIEGQNAFLAEPADVDGLAHAMVKMAKRADLAEMGAIGREKVKTGFRIENSWAEYNKLFLSLGARP